MIRHQICIIIWNCKERGKITWLMGGNRLEVDGGAGRRCWRLKLFHLVGQGLCFSTLFFHNLPIWSLSTLVTENIRQCHIVPLQFYYTMRKWCSIQHYVPVKPFLIKTKLPMLINSRLWVCLQRQLFFLIRKKCTGRKMHKNCLVWFAFTTVFHFKILVSAREKYVTSEV